MRRGKVPADWPFIRQEEAAAVLGRYPELGRSVSIVWHSPRPMSAAVLVRAMPGGLLFVKRHHHTVRDPSALREEHAFGAHLRREDVEVPRVLVTGEGDTVVSRGDWAYEVQVGASGMDAYRDVPSWEPYRSVGHAASAGAALARFHAAAASYQAGVRAPGVLSSSDRIVRAEDPSTALEELVAERPGLAEALKSRPWRQQIGGVVAMLNAARRSVAGLPSQWGHGDWHPSNLQWSGRGPNAEVVGVMDLGLANRTSAVHDVAVALERSVVGWQSLEDDGSAPVDLDAADALVLGYTAQRPLSAPEAAGLVALLPVVHVDFALSEVEYFATVARSPFNLDLAYRGYLLGHAAWFASGRSAATLLERVGRAAAP